MAISRLEVEVFADRVEQIYRERRLRSVVTWTRGRKLGQGGFAEVHIQRRESNELRAVKQLRKNDSNIDWRREVEAAALFSQPKYEDAFVKSLGWYDTADHVYLVMEYLQFGDLSRHMGKRFPELEARSIIHQILVALDYMHERDFIHRDLKPANVLIREEGPDWWVKLADFGISKRVQRSESTLRTKVFTPQFVAPEVRIDDKPYTRAVDIWSTGLIAFLLLSAEHTFLESSEVWQYYMQADALPEHRLADRRLAAFNVSGAGCEFVAQLLSPLPVSRPTAAACLKHEWMPIAEEPSPAARQLLYDGDVSQNQAIEESAFKEETQDLISKVARWTTVDDTQAHDDLRWTTIDASTRALGDEQSAEKSYLRPLSNAAPPKSLTYGPDQPSVSVPKVEYSMSSPDADHHDASNRAQSNGADVQMERPRGVPNMRNPATALGHDTRPMDVEAPLYARRDSVPPLDLQQAQQSSALFDRAGPQNGKLERSAVVRLMADFGLPDHFILGIWYLVDRGSKGALNRSGFVVAMHLAASVQSRAMTKLPSWLPFSLFTAAAGLASPAANRVPSAPPPPLSTSRGSADSTAKTQSASTEWPTLTKSPNDATVISSMISRYNHLHAAPLSEASQIDDLQHAQETQVPASRRWSEASQKLEGHTGPINSVAFSPDGKLLVSASDDETLRSWIVETGAAAWTVKAPRMSWKHVFHCAAFSPSGNVVAAGESGAKVGIYDVATGSCQHVFQGNGKITTGVAYSRGGNILASAGHNDTVLIWDARMRNLLKKLRGYSHQSLSVAFAPDSLMVAAAFTDMTVRIWDTRTWTQQRKLEHDQTPAAIAFSPNGMQLVSASRDPDVSSKMWIWNTWTWTEQRQIFGRARSLAFSPDSRKLATAGFDRGGVRNWNREVKIWDTTTWFEKERLSEHEDTTRAVAFSADGTKIATGSLDNTVRIWSAQH